MQTKNYTNKTITTNKAVARKSLLFMLAIIALAIFSLGGVLLSQNFTNADALPDVSNAIYHFFTRPTAMAAESASALLVADGRIIYRFNIATGDVSELFYADGYVEYMVISGGRLVTVQRSQLGDLARIYSFPIATGATGTQLFAAEGFENIAVLGTTLHASRVGDHRLWSLDLNTNTPIASSPRTLQSGGDQILTPIRNLTAGNNHLYVAFNPGNLIAHRFDANAVYAGTRNLGGFPHVDFMVHHPGNAAAFGEVLIFASGRIFLMGDSSPFNFINMSAYSALNSVTIGPDGRVFKLNHQGAISDFNLFGSSSDAMPGLVNERILLANRSGIIPGFFDTPRDTTSSNGMIFTADYHNSRIYVQYGQDNFRAPLTLRLPQPISVSARYDYLFVAYSRNWIVQFRINEPNQDPTFVRRFQYTRDGSPSISKIEVCSYGNLYILDETRQLRVLAANQVDSANRSFVLIENAVVAISAAAWSPNMYFAVAGATTYDIYSITANGIRTNLFSADSVIDIAVDKCGSIYVLCNTSSQYEITRYETTGGATPTFTAVNYIVVDYSPIAITLARVDFRPSDLYRYRDMISYRDIIVTDTIRHRVRHISIYATNSSSLTFDIENSFVTETNVDRFLFPNPLVAIADSNDSILFTLDASAQIFMNATDVFPIIRGGNTVTLPAGFNIIIPTAEINFESDFTFVIADNYPSFTGSPLMGYVRSILINPTARVYEQPNVGSGASISLEAANGGDVRIYKFPTVTFPNFVIMSSTVTMQNFVTTLDENLQPVFGYFDNRNTALLPYLNEFNQWFRISFMGDGGARQGFVLASSVRLAGTNERDPDTFVTNAVVVPWDFRRDCSQYATNCRCLDLPNGARIFAVETNYDGNIIGMARDADGRPTPFPYLDYIRFGRRVMVVGRFDRSQPYHRIRYLSQFGEITVYIRTPNIEYDGVDLVALITIIVVGLTVICTGLAVARYLQVKKTGAPKKTAESFI